MSYIKENTKDGTFECKVCHIKNDSYVQILKHRHYTVREWNGFLNTVHEGQKVGNDFQYYNHVTQRAESYDYLTTAEILCMRHEIILTDYRTRKQKIFDMMDKFSIENLNRGIDRFNRGVEQFSKSVESRNKNNVDLSALFSEPKKKSKRKPRTQKPDYSALIGKKKIKFF